MQSKETVRIGICTPNLVIEIFNLPVIVTFEPLRFFQVQIDISLSAFELDISQPP